MNTAISEINNNPARISPRTCFVYTLRSILIFFSRIKCFFLYIYIQKYKYNQNHFSHFVHFHPSILFMKLFILIYDYCYPHDIKSDNIIAQNIRIFQESKKERLNRFNFKKKTPSFSLSLSLKLLFTMEISSRTCLSQLFLLQHPPSSSRKPAYKCTTTRGERGQQRERPPLPVEKNFCMRLSYRTGHYT